MHVLDASTVGPWTCRSAIHGRWLGCRNGRGYVAGATGDPTPIACHDNGIQFFPLDAVSGVVVVGSMSAEASDPANRLIYKF